MQYSPELIAKLKKAVAKTIQEDRESQLAVVECASKLNTLDQNKLKNILTNIFTRKMEIKYLMEPDLLAGFRIIVGDWNLDMSLLTELQLWTKS